MEGTMTRGRARLCIALLVLLGFALGASEFTVIGVETELAESFGVGLERVGELISWYSAAYAVLTPVLAVVTGRFRRYTLLLAYASVFVAANVVMTFAPTFELLLLSRVLLGGVSGALLAVGITCIPELVEARRVPGMISLVYAAFSVSMVVVTSVGRMVSHVLHWRLVFVGAFVLSVAVSLALVALLPRSGATDEAATMRDQASLLCEPQVLCGMLVFLFGVGSVYVFYGYVTPYLEGVLGMEPMGASMVLMAFGVMCFFSNLLSGWLDERLGLRTLLVCFPVLACLLAGLWALGDAMPWALGAVLAVGLVMYFLCVPCVSMFMRTARRRHPKALTLASSLEPTSFNIGIATGTAVGGAVVAGPGIAGVGLVGAALALVAWGLGAVTFLLDRRRNGSDPEAG